jgi:hypothetical protein
MPAPTATTDEPVTVQTRALTGSAEKTTGRPELEVAVTTYAGSPTVVIAGGVDENVMLCVMRLTLRSCWVCGAAR